jgi:predicted Zn-dependent peptidase
MLGFPTSLYGNPDNTATDVLSQVLGFRMFQRLRPANRLFNRGVYRASAHTDRSFAHGILYTHFATVGPYEYALQCANAVAGVCDDLKRTRLSKSERIDLEAEIAAAKYSMDKYYLNAFRRYPDLAVELIIDALVNGDDNFEHLNNTRASIAAVDARSMRKAAEQYLTTPDRFVRVVLKPQFDSIE